MLKNLLYFAILTTFIVISWVAFGIYHNTITTTISGDTLIRIVPISAHFDIETIAKLKSKEVIQADFLTNPNSSISTDTTQASTSASIITTPQASTTSGQIIGDGL